MKKFTKAIISILIAIVSFTSLSLAQEVLDRIAAIVDDDIILESEVTQNTYLLAMQMKIDPNREPEKFLELQKQTLENLIIRQIGIQYFSMVIEYQDFAQRKSSTCYCAADDLILQYLRIHNGSAVLGSHVVQQLYLTCIRVHLNVSEMSGKMPGKSC